MTESLADLTGAEMADLIAAGRISSVEVVEACLARIAEREPAVQAWQFLDPDRALSQARAADLRRRQGRPCGPLNGVPVGLKDVFDTCDMPTENGTPLHAGRRPRLDATAVALLRRAGAVILGKTVTTECAVYTPGKTRNPHDPQRTPGGSSSGSAAAVAAGMVPLATGTQTNGSIIRPASYCGVFGYKPSYGLISRRRVLKLSHPLDHVGVFARSLNDLALMAEPMMGWDAGDRALSPEWPPALTAAARSKPPVTPRLALVRTAAWEQADGDLREGFAELAGEIGVEELVLDAAFDAAWSVLRTIMEADLAANLGALAARGCLSGQLSEMIARGRQVSREDYAAALAQAELLKADLARLLAEYDALVTPATTGQAPRGLEATGNPVFCTLWTLTGVPALSLPLLAGADGLPIGVQLVAAHGDDARLFRTARWLIERLG